MNFKVGQYSVHHDGWGGILEVSHLKRDSCIRIGNISTQTTFGDKTYQCGYESGGKGLLIVIQFQKAKECVTFDWSTDVAFVKDVQKEAETAEVWGSCSYYEGHTKQDECWLDEEKTSCLREEIRELANELEKVFKVREIEFPMDRETAVLIDGELENLDWSEVEESPELTEWLKNTDFELNTKKPEEVM